MGVAYRDFSAWMLPSLKMNFDPNPGEWYWKEKPTRVKDDNHYQLHDDFMQALQYSIGMYDMFLGQPRQERDVSARPIYFDPGPPPFLDDYTGEIKIELCGFNQPSRKSCFESLLYGSAFVKVSFDDLTKGVDLCPKKEQESQKNQEPKSQFILKSGRRSKGKSSPFLSAILESFGKFKRASSTKEP